MIPDTLLEFIRRLTIKSTVKDSVFRKFCDKKKTTVFIQNTKCNDITSLISLIL